MYVRRSKMLRLIICALFFAGSRANLELVLLHTNDVHARVEETNSRGGMCSSSDALNGKCFGGVARRKTAIDAERSRYDNVLLLDGGDQYQGTIWFSYYKGHEAATFMNLLGYDAMSLGNHEFDNGLEGLLPFMRNVSFPVLACNINASREPQFSELLRSYVVLTVSGYKIGVVGFVTNMTSTLVDPVHVKRLSFLPEVESVRRAAREVRDVHGADLVIALGHAGFLVEQEVAQSVAEVDVVVGGHSNTFLYTGSPPSSDVPVGLYPTIVTQASGKRVPVVQDFAYGKYLGKLVLEFDDNFVLQSWSGNPILLNASIAQDASVAAVVGEMSGALDDYRQREVGSSLVLLNGNRYDCRLRECNLGNAITDALVLANVHAASSSGWATSAIAVWNAGGIRSSIEAGPVTLEDVVTVLPFSNEVIRLTVSGSTLLAVLEHSVADYDFTGLDPSGQFLQVSGLRVVYDLSRDVWSRVVSAHALCVDCDVPRYEPVNPANTYKIIANAFIGNGGDGYSMLNNAGLPRENLGYLGSDQFMEYLGSRSPLFPALEGRITFINSTLSPTEPSRTTEPFTGSTERIITSSQNPCQQDPTLNNANTQHASVMTLILIGWILITSHSAFQYV